MKYQKNKFSTLEYTRAKALRKLQCVLVFCSVKDIESAIENNVIEKKLSWKKIWEEYKEKFGLGVPSLKGKTTKKNRKSRLPQEDHPVDIPPSIAKQLR